MCESDIDLDFEIAHEVFGVPKEAIEAWPWPVPEFSGDRRWSAAVVTKICFMDERVRKAFEKCMIDKAEAGKINGGLTEIMVINTPDLICKAALAAVRECGGVKRT